jgi:hypothetical protein
MTTFAVTNTNQLLPAVNYLLSNLDTTGTGNVVLPGNVLVANTSTGVISQEGSAIPFGYLYQYVNLRYSNNATGTAGFDTNSNNYSYFGVYNSATSAASANPTAYQWFQVSPPFDSATSRTLYYSAIGGRQIVWAAASSPPSTAYQITVANVAIDLDVVTTATGTPGDRGPIAVAFVITTADPNGASDIQLTAWFEASRENTTPPIGTGLTPVVGDTATFTYTGGVGQPSATLSYNGSAWIAVDGQVINGNVIIANSVPGNSIVASSVTTTQIASNTITATNIAANTITGNKIASNTITAGQIAATTITADKIATGTITATQIAGNTITANNIQTATITATQIAGNTITANNIQTATITATQIASGTITANNIAGNTITANNIQSGSLTTNVFTANTISGNIISSGTITTDKLAANILVANTVVSTGATLGNFSSPGFWLDGNTGNARFGNTVSIGNNLSVGNNATIGGNLVISGLVSSGNLISNVVQTNNIVTFSVTNTVFSDANPDPTQIIYTNNANLYPNNTRGQAVPSGVAILPTTTSATQGSKILVNYQTYISSAANSEYNLVELWKETVSYSSQYALTDLITVIPQGNAWQLPGVTFVQQQNQPIFAVGTNGATLYSTDLGLTWTNTSNASITSNWTAAAGSASVNYFLPPGGPDQWPGQFSFSRFDSNGVYWANTASSTDGWNANLTQATTSFNNGTGRQINDALPITTGTGGNLSYPVRPTVYVGSGGTVYRTSGLLAGNTWSSSATAESSTVSTDLYAVGSNTTNPGGATQSTSINLVAVGAQGTIITNSRIVNGTTGALVSSTGWTSRISNTVQNLNGVGYNNNDDVWMIVGNQGSVLTSPASGTTWTNKPSPTPANLNDVICIVLNIAPFTRYWIAVGNGGTLLVSTDTGNTWTAVSTPASNGSLGFIRNLYAVTYTKDSGLKNDTVTAALVSGDGVIMRSSPPFTTWTVVYDAGFVQNSDLQRVEYYGSYANVFTTTQPSTIQRLGNNQVIAGTFIDSNFTANIPVKYYLYAGSMLANNAVYVQGSTLTATEFKR